MHRAEAKGALALLAAALVVGGCAARTAAPSPASSLVAAPGCGTAELSIAFDFEGAAPARCVIEGPRSIALLIGPEHAPPINPSPWYAFRYRSDAPVTVTLRYLNAKHRYAPKLTAGETVVELTATPTDEGRSARVELPQGQGIVSGQPIVTGGRYAAFAERLERDFAARRFTIGRSLDGRPIEALRFGASDAPRLIVLLGRQHPPEVTGHQAMEPFVHELAAVLKANPVLARRYQVLAVPLLNPDGVALGHWRANRGGVDLNRDWGPFSQPETRAVRDYLTALPAAVRPVVMIDFHSTWRNLFYVQGKEATPAQTKFIADWLVGRGSRFAGYDFEIEPSDAADGSSVAKNWFHATYAIPAITYEVGDKTEPAATDAAARELARGFMSALDSAAGSTPRD